MDWFDDDNTYAAQLECHECRHLRLEGPSDQEFVVTPADGGGWMAWSAALLRLIQRMGLQPTQGLVIGQDTFTQRYVQALIGHGIAHVEASSNTYLEGTSRLEPEHEELLTLLGWQPPVTDRDDPDQMPANWSLPLVRGDWATVVELLSATVIGVFGSVSTCRSRSAPSCATSPARLAPGRRRRSTRVSADHVCDHRFARPWSTCVDCMSLPTDERPEPPPVAAPPKVARKGVLPVAAKDGLPTLDGDKDISVAVHDFDKHSTGDDNDWIICDSGFPHDLRAGGWL